MCKNKIINYAIDNNNVKILNWYKNFGYYCYYDYNMIVHAFNNGNIEFLKWLKINFGLKHWKNAFLYMYRRYRIIVLNFLIQNVKIKNVVKVAKGFDFIKTIKFKTKNKYLKGYNKN